MVDAAEHADGQGLLEITKAFRAGQRLVINKVEDAYVILAKDMRDGSHLHLPEAFRPFEDHPIVGERFHALVRHRELAVVFIAVGKREGDNVVACRWDVALHTVGRKHRKALHRRA